MRVFLVHADGSWSEHGNSEMVGVAVVLSEADKSNISSMESAARVYCAFPDDYDRDVVAAALQGIREAMEAPDD